MARYMETAAKANDKIRQIISEIEETFGVKDNGNLAAQIGEVYNLGIRTAPRGVQGTVRKNAVEAALKDLGVNVTMTKVTDPDTGKSFNALSIIPK